jgi:putative DNA primase/helicase
MSTLAPFDRRDAMEQFQAALTRRGILLPSEIIADGRLHRCHVKGKGGRGDAAYLLHLGAIPAGGFQNWCDGLGWENWRADLGRAFTQTEKTAYLQRVEAMLTEQEALQAQRHERAREKAVSLWQQALPVDVRPYLTLKQVKTYEIKHYRGLLVIPLRDTNGVIHSLQFISAKGEKRFLKGGAITGHYHAIGKYQGVLCICEGYATGATVHQATGHAVAVAFNAGNLKPVAILLRKKFPQAQLIPLCG